MTDFMLIMVVDHDEVVRATAATAQVLQSGVFDWHAHWSVQRGGRLDVRDEGITWIRGDHDKCSIEVASLKAANMLARDELSYTGPRISFHEMRTAQLPRSYPSKPSAPPRFQPVPARNASSFRRR
jgi:hypothetical protein